MRYNLVCIVMIQSNQAIDGLIQEYVTNTSIFDRPYFEALFGGAEFPDGTLMIDYEEKIMKFQEWFMEEMAEIRKHKMFTFPINTISLLRKDGKFKDEKFAEWAIKHNMQWSDSNFFISDTVSSLSNCCFDGHQEVSIRYTTKTDSLIIKSGEFSKLYEEFGDGQIVEAMSPDGGWAKAKFVRTTFNELVKVNTKNKNKLFMTLNHICPTEDGDILAANLKVGMKLKNYEEYEEITHIERYNNSDENNYVYCLEMQDQSNPYFVLMNGIITHNCRLKSDITNLYFNSIGGTALNVGSIKVSTINLARIALDVLYGDSAQEDKESLYIAKLQERVRINLMALDCVRHIIKRNVDKGLLPNFTHGLIDFKHCYNTCGFIGCFEALKSFGYTKMDEFGNTYYTPEASYFGKKIFDAIHASIESFKEEFKTDYMINLEQIPGESAADKLMQKDKFFYPNASIYDLPLYGNQFIPLGIKTTLQERIRIAAEFDGYCSAGSILHANIDAPFDSYQKAREMVEYIADAGVTYFAFNSRIQSCENRHAFYGTTCPQCGKPVTSEFTRIAGFYTSVNTWAKKRREEFTMRYWHNMNSPSALLQ